MPDFITANREDARSEREFQRDQRAALYSDFMAAIDESQVLMEPFLPGPVDLGAAMTTVGEYLVVADDDEMAQIKDANRRVTSTAGRIAVIGGNVTTLADALEQDLRQIEGFIETVKECQLGIAAGRPCESLAGDLLSSADGDRSSIGEFELDRDRFIAATREELNTSD